MKQIIIGYCLAMWHPERITAIISQNGNMYEEGLGKKWEARKDYRKNPGNIEGGRYVIE